MPYRARSFSHPKSNAGENDVCESRKTRVVNPKNQHPKKKSNKPNDDAGKYSRFFPRDPNAPGEFGDDGAGKNIDGPDDETRFLRGR